MSGSLVDLERVFRAVTADLDRVSSVMTTVPASRGDLIAILTLARAAGRRSGAPLRRVELSKPALQSIGGNFHEVPLVDAQSDGVMRLVFERDAAVLERAA